MPRVTPLFARFSRGLVGGAFNLPPHLANGAPFVSLLFIAPPQTTLQYIPNIFLNEEHDSQLIKRFIDGY